MLSVVVALRLWGPSLADKNICIHSDNQAVVAIINSQKTHDPYLAAAMRNIWLLVALYNIQITSQHISDQTNNLADSLSRYHEQKHLNGKYNYVWDNVFDSMLVLDWVI